MKEKMPSPEELKKIQEENMSEKQIEQSAVREENYNAGHEAGKKEAQASKQELEEMKKADETESAEKHAALLKELKGEGNGETAEPKEGNKEKLGEEFENAKAEYEKIDELYESALAEVRKISGIVADKFNSSAGELLTRAGDYNIYENPYRKELEPLLKNTLRNPEKYGTEYVESLKFNLEKGFKLRYFYSIIEKFKLKRDFKELVKSILSLSEEYKAALNKLEGLGDEHYEKQMKFSKLGGKEIIQQRKREKEKDYYWQIQDELEERSMKNFLRNKYGDNVK